MKIKANVLRLLGVLLIVQLSSCVKDLEDPVSAEIMSREQLDQNIIQEMRDGQLFDWRNQSARTIWSAAMQSDSLVAVGYCLPGQKDLSESIHLIDTEAPDWQENRREVLDKILFMESKGTGTELSDKDILMPHMIDEWPTLFVVVSQLETVEMLMELDNVRFVEPTGYYPEENAQRNSSGCGSAVPNYSIPSADYASISPSVKLPWNFNNHQISSAWGKTTGQGEKVGIIDSGVSFQQDNLNGNFNSGWSSGRSVSKLSTKWSGSWWWASLDSPDDRCGHGTSMAGVSTAPRGSDGNSVGVAYNAGLVSVRAVEDVIISSSNEKRGVRDALKLIANRSDVRIASMSIGTPFYSSTVQDGINYAYNRGTLILAAAGTSLSWTTWYGVIYPATSSRTVAVTGVDESNRTCTYCHDGSKVDFTITMERNASSSRTSLALAEYGNQPAYVGGSSVATATTAGIAALVWSKNPNWSRWSVINKLKTAAANYPNRDSDHGWGRINANQAVQ